MAAIKAKGSTDTEDLNILTHAMAHGIIAHIGIGMRTNVDTFCSRRGIIPSNVCGTLSNGEVCRASAYTTGGTSFSLSKGSTLRGDG